MSGPTNASVSDELANLAAGNGFPTQLRLRIDTDLKSHLPPKLGQHIRIAGGFVSETEVEPFVHFTRVQLLLQNPLRKLPRGHQRQISPKSKEYHRIYAGAFKQAQLLRRRREQLQSRLRPQNPRWMRLKGHGNCLPPLRA